MEKLMRRSASEILRNLERRIARLEKQSSEVIHAQAGFQHRVINIDLTSMEIFFETRDESLAEKTVKHMRAWAIENGYHERFSDHTGMKIMTMKNIDSGIRTHIVRITIDLDIDVNKKVATRMVEKELNKLGKFKLHNVGSKRDINREYTRVNKNFGRPSFQELQSR